MNTIYFYLILIILTSRSIFQISDKSLTLKRTIYKTIFELSSLLIIEMELTTMFIAISLILMNLLSYILDKREDKYLYRFISIILYVIGLSVFFNNSSYIKYNYISQLFFNFIESNILIVYIHKLSVLKIIIILSGAFYIANEMNYLIIFILDKLKLLPSKKESEESQIQVPDYAELRRGKTIGILERLLIYFFVVNGSLASIGFIIAAKSFTRFKELDNREFAEYVLIGTLLSSSFAITVGIFVKLLI